MAKNKKWDKERWFSLFEDVTATLFEDWSEGMDVGSTIDNIFSEHEDELKIYFEVEDEEGD